MFRIKTIFIVLFLAFSTSQIQATIHVGKIFQDIFFILGNPKYLPFQNFSKKMQKKEKTSRIVSFSSLVPIRKITHPEKVKQLNERIEFLKGCRGDISENYKLNNYISVEFLNTLMQSSNDEGIIALEIEGDFFILDGHGRYFALYRAIDGINLMDIEITTIAIDKDSLNSAKRSIAYYSEF